MRPAPPVVAWYKVHAALMAAFYLAVLLAFVSMPLWAHPRTDAPPPWLPAVVVTFVCLPIVALHVAALFLPVKPWAWICHLLLICFSLSFGCMPVSIALLIFWIRPETKAYFGH